MLRCTLTLLVALPTIAAATPPPADPVASLAWMAGVWESKSETRYAEEHWSAPRAGRMMGMFRLLEKGVPTFYELMVIERQGQEVRLMIRHLDAALSPWPSEAKGPLTYTLSAKRSSPQRAVFANPTDKVRRIEFISKDGNKRLIVRLVFGDGPAAPTRDFIYERAPREEPSGR